MNLILQSRTAERSAIENIAAKAHAMRIEAIHAHAWRCVEVDPGSKEAVEAASLKAGVDATFIRAGMRMSDFGLVAMDMDSTAITIECIDEIADMQGLKPQVAQITEAAMRGEIEFRESLTRRVALLEGLDAGALQRVYDERLHLSPGLETMLATARAVGWKTLLVSGGFTFFTDRVRERLGLDYSHSNRLEIVDGKLTGRVIGDIVDAEEKRRTVERVCSELDMPTSRAIVMGDGANDLKMMAVAGLSVAYRAKPIVRAQADVALNFSGLDGILALFEQ
ncbi:phosphoserine phosphatase SerB [Noviherbaspirillum pedocola]|uniref:Phosphoserine phosphatase n=1 Tax=Noviherbaspirillum pedocola TaxID=2801341 RepID=A0A934SVL8_9BURK|nr:phosphoserine phosphatase SerB [Noviherbaspirillum pedocola]MBK4736235.1 phosphoserine phosphatase SerB [Noviherbaspirillum pedocola]